ncbi:aromatic-ring-hydroxylating dioxygenase subunit beta [Haliea sp. E1-2-M8]|uniref:aromatic-ring-hydroxylating dioxygenase subunit beta n=1 Tax=Haliea sp. E1-2-M8 TaxID=3064706 RepID=UPI002727A70C|nr:aromatic-ring-hydroxylating dioxygenase subunit beta [Haliea sp. E1-2-M8]MDO8864108.1 aromatic-ring-hydroxylating dioxygenase subunit beta [Haliea sp. E1-2-M8]
MTIHVDLALLAEVEQFLYREARLQDTHAYDDWEALWTDDAIYWIPANGADIDPEQKMSIIYDNRSRIGLRIKQFHTGQRHTQMPRSSLGRVVSNVEIIDDDGKEIRVASNAMIYESNLRGETVWATRNEFLLRRNGDGLRMACKKVVLVNNDKPIYTMSFLV